MRSNTGFLRSPVCREEPTLRPPPDGCRFEERIRDLERSLREERRAFREVRFHTIADLQRRLASYQPPQASASARGGVENVFPIVFFCIALGGLIAGFTYHQPVFFGSAIYFTFFEILFWRISLLTAQIARRTHDGTREDNEEV